MFLVGGGYRGIEDIGSESFNILVGRRLGYIMEVRKDLVTFLR